MCVRCWGWDLLCRFSRLGQCVLRGVSMPVKAMWIGLVIILIIGFLVLVTRLGYFSSALAQCQYQRVIIELSQYPQYHTYYRHIHLQLIRTQKITTQNPPKKPMNNTQTKNITEQLITDLQIINNLSKKQPEYLDPNTNNINLTTMHNLLTMKNSRYIENDQAWVRNRKVDIRPLLDRVEKVKEQMRDVQDQIAKSQRSFFYISDTGLAQQSQYLVKNLEYMVFSSVQRTLTAGTICNIPTNKRKKLKKFDFTLPNPANTIIPLTKPRNQIKAEIYIKAVQNTFLTQSRYLDMLTSFKSTTKLKFWQILYNLLPQNITKNMEQNTKIGLYRIALLSLKMVESEINLTLPSNYDSLVYYLQTNYLRKLTGKYQVQGSLGPIWGVAYLLYKAGRKQEFYQYLPDPEMRRMFIFVDESIMAQQPQKINQVQQNGDVFHDQLAYVLCGQSKYSSEYLCDPNSLDISWVFLRNVGIFPDRQQKFMQLQQDITKAYKISTLTQANIKNLLYLLCFDYLVEIGANEMMDQDDYLHFLIVLYHSEFKFFCRNIQKLERKLTQRLTQFIQPLLIDNKKQSLFYIALTPINSLSKQISTVIATTKQLDKLKWKDLQKLIPSNYQELLTLTCTKYVEMYQGYILAAQKIYELLNNWQSAIKYIMKMFIRNTLVNDLDRKQLRRGEDLVKQIFSKNQLVKIEYEPVFQFFKQHSELISLLKQRNQQKLYSFVKSAKHILVTQHLRLDTKKVLQKLIQAQDSIGFDCYIQYMIDVVKAYEIALTKMGRIYDLQELQRLTLSALTGFMQNGPQTRYQKRDTVNMLGKMLEEGLYRYS